MAENKTLASDSDFKSWVSQLKQDIRSAQVKAAIKVNTELLRLYWRMGADICEKQKSASWGDGWLNELSRELMAEFPDMKGFSYRNLRYIRQWYEFYYQRITFWQQPVAKLGEDNWATSCCPIRRCKYATTCCTNQRGGFLLRSLGASSVYHIAMQGR